MEKAQQMTAHESAKTTKLYDRTNDAIILDEVERIAFGLANAEHPLYIDQFTA